MSTELSKKGDQISLVSYVSEGFCYLSHNSTYRLDYCPEGEFQPLEVESDDSFDMPELGNYVFTKCNEGHYTWIPVSVFENDEENFKSHWGVF